MQECFKCGAVRPEWLGGFHHCPANFVRYTRVPNAPWGQSTCTPEPHTLDEFELGYLATGNPRYAYNLPSGM